MKIFGAPQKFTPRLEKVSRVESWNSMSIWNRTIAEIRHWLRRDWSFADVAAHWDRTEEYDDINSETYSYFRRFEDALRLIDLPSPGHILDIDARTGNGTLYFYQNGKVASAVCASVSSKMGEIGKTRLQEAGFQDFEWVQNADYDLPFEDAEFDLVLCFETVEHFSQPELLISELGRVTKPGGTMILTTPNIVWEPVHALSAITGLHHSEGPHRFIQYRRLVEMVENAGFQIQSAKTTVLIPGGPALLVRLGEWLETRTKNSLMPILGLRRSLICTKR